MGWTGYAVAPRDPRDEIARLCTFETDDRVAGPVMITKRGSTYYVAVRALVKTGATPPKTFEIDEDRAYVFGAVFLTSRRCEAWGYKDMDETMGPGEAGAPAALLNLLSPTTCENALRWRERCRNVASLRSRKLADGDVIRFADPISFGDGVDRQTFRVVVARFPGVRTRTVFICADTGARCRISGFKARAWEIIESAGPGASA